MASASAVALSVLVPVYRRMTWYSLSKDGSDGPAGSASWMNRRSTPSSVRWVNHEGQRLCARQGLRQAQRGTEGHEPDADLAGLTRPLRSVRPVPDVLGDASRVRR